MSPAPRLQIDGVVEARQGLTDGCCDFSSMEELDAGNTGRGLDLQIARSGQKRLGPVKIVVLGVHGVVSWPEVRLSLRGNGG